ncbi:MAG: nucleotidyltransferase [Sphingobacteriia bacterium]|nr:nucleotidyltransferase [Sphingobacteriia bacterium]
MKIIVPMAGMGKRLRPHTLTTPKPLLPIAGKPIVQRLVEDIVAIYKGQVDEIAYIVGDFGKEAENHLLAVAEKLGANGTIYYQEEALGTAHAIHCAGNSVSGEVIVAFADTLFRADFQLDPTADGVIWVKTVENPKQFGVVTLTPEGHINAFVEKPTEFVSDLAIIGIYYFKNGDELMQEIQYLLDNDIRDKGEFQLTNALENMKNKGRRFVAGKVDDWMDCGNKENVLATNTKILDYLANDSTDLYLPDNARFQNAWIIEPSFIGEGVSIENCIVGPHVSIGKGSQLKNVIVKESILREYSQVENAVIENSILGNHSQFKGKALTLNLGDYTEA